MRGLSGPQGPWLALSEKATPALVVDVLYEKGSLCQHFFENFRLTRIRLAKTKTMTQASIRTLRGHLGPVHVGVRPGAALQSA